VCTLQVAEKIEHVILFSVAYMRSALTLRSFGYPRRIASG
jgi:hypothetical protein